MKRAILHIDHIAIGSRVAVFHSVGSDPELVTLFNEIVLKPTLRVELPMLHKLMDPATTHDSAIVVRVRDMKHTPGEWTRVVASEEMYINAWRPKDRILGKSYEI